MSGGYFDYQQRLIQDIEQSIGRAGASFELSAEAETAFLEARKALRVAYVYAQRIDWLLCGDDDEEAFHRRLKEDLAKLETE